MVSYVQSDGHRSDILNRIVVDKGDAVAVLVHIVGPDADFILCVRQFRYPSVLTSVPHHPDDGWMTELVAGLVDPGEDPEHTAIRELFEETTLKVDDVEFMSYFFTSPGGSNERTFLYYARAELDPNDMDLEKRHGLEDEDLQLVLLRPADFLAQIADNRIFDAKTMVAAEWVRRNAHRFVDLSASI